MFYPTSDVPAGFCAIWRRPTPMNIANSIRAGFIPVFLAIELLVFAFSAYQLFKGNDLLWLAPAFSSLPALILALQGKSWLAGVKSVYFPFHSALVVIAVLAGLVIAARSPATSDPVAMILMLIAAAGFFLFVFWLPRNGRKLNDRLAAGQSLPEFNAQDETGAPVSTRELLGRPALIMFYRGNWCPVCSSQVSDLVAHYRTLADMNTSIVMVSPQPHELTRRVAAHFDLPMHFWVDQDNQAAAILGIVDEDGVPLGFRGTHGSDTVLPTAIIVDSDGTILFTDQTSNYRVRPQPETFIRVLKRHAASV